LLRELATGERLKRIKRLELEDCLEIACEAPVESCSGRLIWLFWLLR
jgi:hypothetical protein